MPSNFCVHRASILYVDRAVAMLGADSVCICLIAIPAFPVQLRLLNRVLSHFAVCTSQCLPSLQVLPLVSFICFLMCHIVSSVS